MGAVVVTGASSGLGGALALAYAGPGAALGLVGRDAMRLEATAAACRDKGAAVETAVLDVAEAGPLADWLLDFDTRHPIGLVVANAGTSGGPAPGEGGEGAELAGRQVRTNLIGAINTIEPLLPLFMARGGCAIGIVASIAAFRGLPYSPAYCASKAGVRAYGEALRARLRPRGVAVTVVCPGFFASRMADRFKGPKPGFRSTAAVADLVKRGLDRGTARVGFPAHLILGLRLADMLPPRIGDLILRGFPFRIVQG